MEKIISDIQSLYSSLKGKQSTLDQREQELQSLRNHLGEQAIRIKVKEGEINIRESALIKIENIINYRKKADDLYAKISAESFTLSEDKKKFELYKAAELQKLERDRITFEKDKKALEDKEKNLEKTITTKVAKVMAGFVTEKAKEL